MRTAIRAVAAAGFIVAFSLAAVAQKGGTDTRALHGQVINKEGAGLEKAVVYLKNTKNLQVRTYIADEGGAFHFQGLATNVDYEVRAEHEGGASPVRTVSSFDSRKEVNLTLRVEKK